MVGVAEDPPPVIPWDEFTLEYFRYRPGEHLAMFGPTGVGKTTYAMKMMAVARQDYPHLRGIVAVMKKDKGPTYLGRNATGDPTVSRLSKQLGGRIRRTWPPFRWPWQEEPTFWVHWPRHSDDPIADQPRHSAQFRTSILDSYNTGGRMYFADEVYSLQEELGLERHLNTVWTKGRSMECGLWGASQRAAHVSRWMYSMSSHLFLWTENDKEGRKRYGEISRLDSRRVEEVLGRLTKHEALYLNPDHPEGPRWAVLR